MSDYRPKFDQYKYPMSPAYLSNLRDIYYDVEYVKPAIYKYVSRYQETRQIIDAETRNVHHETFNYKVIKESKEDKYLTVDNISANRLDIISLYEYGSPTYWWVLAVANNILDPFNISLDTIIRIPPLFALYNKGGVLEDAY